jgi:hypothetical protein
MRIPENPINPMVLFWYLVYGLALFLIFVTEILWWIAKIQKKAPARRPIRKINPNQKCNQAGPRK